MNTGSDDIVVPGESSEESGIVATGTVSPGDAEAVRCLRESISCGRDWYLSLLQSIGLWTSSSEDFDERTWLYLIDGEAFDWLLLADRLCGTVDGLIPEYERDALLFNGIVPVDLDAGEIKKLIGDQKYRQYLNYFYGITVEEGLLLAVQDEVEKENRSRILRSTDGTEESYLRVYEIPREELLHEFRKEKGYPYRKTTTLTEMKEFTYWLFKYRFKRSEKARIASDTRKSLAFLSRQWRKQGIFSIFGADPEL